MAMGLVSSMGIEFGKQNNGTRLNVANGSYIIGVQWENESMAIQINLIN